ncbi:Polysaccharide pyruvyl transferase [Rubripirellula amarantea]|uniref:Polysaccharide pyruvyl transferase n=1 Tax=Rubripirellula amarantea TaxID=2527999 RepID=A0A5C5WFW4_9BACT|nr:polysaccharide pyruvyl transferase family protein [Rubripirellula amarantea]TWT49648.1 Polysaccharide pyruvyl transferase [Rubripirellula amarantea]
MTASANASNVSSDQYVLYGSFGGWNVGDEAILATVENLLSIPKIRNTGEQRKFNRTVICTRVREGARELYEQNGRRIVLAKDFSAIAKALRGRQLIIGGGQILTGDKSYKGLIFLVILTTMARVLSRRAIMVGIGVEGVHRRVAKLLCRVITNNCQRVDCRDEYSQEMLKQAGCDAKRLNLMADVVLSKAIAGEHLPGLVDDSDANNLETLESHASELPMISVGLHFAPSRSYASTDEMSALASTIAEAFPDHTVSLVSNDCRAGFDEEMLTNLESQIQHPRIRFCHFDYPDQVVQNYARSVCVVSVRMHPLILALIHRVPVVGIRRSNKVIQLSQRVPFPLHDWGNDPHEHLIDLIRVAINGPAPSIDHLANLAASSFQSATAESHS